jgi:hypothetical protein
MVRFSSMFLHFSSRISLAASLVTPAPALVHLGLADHLRSVSALIPSRPATALTAAYSES